MSSDSEFSGGKATPVASYIRTQATVAAIFNAVLNPLFGWLSNKGTDFMPLWASDGIARATATSTIILSLLVALFTAHGANHELNAGRISTHGGTPEAGRLLSRLPRRGSLLGLLLGVGVALLVTLVFWLLHLLGVSGLSLPVFLVFIGVYGGSLGFLVARWVILRQLAGQPKPVTVMGEAGHVMADRRAWRRRPRGSRAAGHGPGGMP